VKDCSRNMSGKARKKDGKEKGKAAAEATNAAALAEAKSKQQLNGRCRDLLVTAATGCVMWGTLSFLVEPPTEWTQEPTMAQWLEDFSVVFLLSAGAVVYCARSFARKKGALNILSTVLGLSAAFLVMSQQWTPAGVFAIAAGAAGLGAVLYSDPEVTPLEPEKSSSFGRNLVVIQGILLGNVALTLSTQAKITERTVECTKVAGFAGCVAGLYVEAYRRAGASEVGDLVSLFLCSIFIGSLIILKSVATTAGGSAPMKTIGLGAALIVLGAVPFMVNPFAELASKKFRRIQEFFRPTKGMMGYAE